MEYARLFVAIRMTRGKMCVIRTDVPASESNCEMKGGEYSSEMASDDKSGAGGVAGASSPEVDALDACRVGGWEEW